MIVDDPEFAGAGRFRLLAIRLVATGFVLLAGLAGVAGLLWIASAFRGRIHAPAGDGPGPTFVALFVPVSLSVVGTLFLYRVGQGLRRRRKRARWAAVVVLVPACVPPLTLFFGAARAWSDVGMVVSLLMLLPTAWAALLLSSPATDPLFSTKGPARLDAPGGSTKAEVVPDAPLLKLALAAVVVALMIALILMASRR